MKAIRAVKPPRGYEKLFAIEKLQEIAADVQDPNEVAHLAVRAIECARADIRDAQFAVDEHAAEFEDWLQESQLVVDKQRALCAEANAKLVKL